MKVTIFNDTRVSWRLHVGSERGNNGERDILKQSGVEFEVPEGKDVFVKVWGKMAMVRYGGEPLAVRSVPSSLPPPMHENFDALVWRAEQADIHGDIFTVDALRQMADGLPPGTVVSDNFDIRRKTVGHVVRAWIDGHDLYVTATFDDEHLFELIRQNEAAIRPGFSVEAMHKDEAGDTVIDKIGVSHVAVVPNPIPLPGERQCVLCEAPIPDDGGIDVCGRCIVERQS